jgi:hypothetical protein
MSRCALRKINFGPARVDYDILEICLNRGHNWIFSTGPWLEWTTSNSTTKKQPLQVDRQAKLNNEQWQALIALHRLHDVEHDPQIDLGSPNPFRITVISFCVYLDPNQDRSRIQRQLD